ncbi:glutaredoxin domain-containing cysteine-rich protein 2 [Periophthalmus magnuspinnatus]|uniref:glutaredoxin domain-containing cysteine-rich protein 2 n=1 Tax=Periophthalmus magnuspinnatus TaxID=409849 RepID=UPI00145A97D9|nr:glutaredoxin domain-containing cysteine-rich protein 2 [Periophthalmus magnuspinnatus]
MEELQRKLDQRYETTNPRKVRFKLASSYSGRVLKHVYEDGQELDSPAEKYPHSFVHRKIPPSHLEMDQYCGFEDGSGGDHQGTYPPTGLIAHRINVYRGVGSYKAAPGQSGADEGDAKKTMLDFGKIIIYTSNLRIIRAPPRKPEPERPHGAPAGEKDGHPKAKERGSGSRRRRAASSAQPSQEKEEKHAEGKDSDSCQQCGGSGCAPCSLCHGSKLSMLANRFNESISDLRCQACYPLGLERCQSCSAK